jgi:hypothetical protein
VHGARAAYYAYRLRHAGGYGFDGTPASVFPASRIALKRRDGGPIGHGGS